MLQNATFVEKITLKQIILIGLALRLIAAIFSQGYSHHDDHFLVVEVAASWVDGEDVADWFVADYDQNTSGRSVIYPGMHYLIFKALEFFGIGSVKTQMLLVRVLQAFYSCLVILFAYRLTKIIDGGEKEAKFIALLCAILWCMPNISARSLTEVVAIPPLMIGSFWALKAIKEKTKILPFLLSGILFGLAFSFRYQVSVYVLGFILGLAIWKEWKAITFISLSGLFYFVVVHGYGDYLMTGKYFGKVIYYVDYNLQFAADYIKLPWYNHLLVVAGFLVPPVGIFLLIGTFKTKMKYLPLFLGVITFLLIHSAMQGKQERFMYTMFPFFVILGYLGWVDLNHRIKSSAWHTFEKGAWKFVFAVNLVALVFLSTWYGKKSRVEAMVYFENKPITSMIVANEELDNSHMLPRAYSGQWFDILEYRAQFNFEDFSKNIEQLEGNKKPNYILFEVAPDSENHTLNPRWKSLFPSIRYETRIHGSLMDNLHYKANPVVKNFEYEVYKIY